jgi:hypothetical protein
MARKGIARVGPFISAQDAERAARTLRENRIEGVVEEVLEWLCGKAGCTRRKARMIRIPAEDASRARRVFAAPAR